MQIALLVYCAVILTTLLTVFVIDRVDSRARAVPQAVEQPTKPAESWL